MGILRAKVKSSKDFWEIELLDLKIAADGTDETSMLKNLQELLIAEYHFAKHFNQTPFVRLFIQPPHEVSKSWEDGSKSLRVLDLPMEVRLAIAAVMQIPSPDFKLGTEPSKAA